MKRRILLRKGMALLSVAVFTAELWGCGTEEKSEEKKTLRVVTEETFYHSVKDAAEFTEGTNSEIQVEIQALVTDKAKREAEIQKLRTEIMAGKGPDVFLMDSIPENAIREGGFLMENPYKTMQSGALASLDIYMEKDAYWKDSSYNEVFLKAGQYDGRQYIIPMSVSYYVLPRPKDMEEMTGDTLGEWLEQIRASDDIRLKQMLYTFTSHSARWMQPAVNYETKEVLFEKEKWMGFLEEHYQFEKETYKDVVGKEKFQYFEATKNTLFKKNASQLDMQVVPDINGKKMATIMSYGAVARSSDLKKEAYDFLMLFLNDQTEQYSKKHADDSATGLPSLLGYLDGINMPVQESAFWQWADFPSEEMLQEMRKTFRELDGAYFLTEGDRALNDAVMTVLGSMRNPDDDMKMEISKMADNAIATYKILVSE